MNAFIACVIFFFAYSISSCSREDGLPDPSVQVLVPCNVDASADDPLACPPTPAKSMDDGGGDGGTVD